LRYWIRRDRGVAERILDLLEIALWTPYEGKGKLEPLRFALAGCWSRLISQEHRLVYWVEAERVEFLQTRYRY